MREGGLDRNVVLLTRLLVKVQTRQIGAAGRSLVELRLRVAKPPRRGETAAHETVPITVWDEELGAALVELAPDTPLVVVGRVSARDWTAPSGQVKTFVEIVAERVTVDAELVPEAAPAADQPVAAPAPRGRGRPDDDEVPF